MSRKLSIITMMFIILSVMISLYLGTFERNVVSIFPAILLTTGLVLGLVAVHRTIIRERKKDMVINTLIALIFALGMSYIVPQMFVPESVVKLDLMSASLLAVLMAVAEEVFFRYFLFNFFLDYGMGMWVSNTLQAVTWASYHAAVYGNQPGILVYIFLTGIIFGWVDYRAGSIAPSIMAHSIVNFLATGGV